MKLFSKIFALVTLAPSYVLLMLHKPAESSVLIAQGKVDDRAEAGKAQVLIGQMLPMLSGTTTPMEAVQEALAGKPDGVSVTRISWSGDATGWTINLGGTALNREGINALKKELEAKGIYKSVQVPVSDLVGVSGNQFNVTLVAKR